VGDLRNHSGTQVLRHSAEEFTESTVSFHSQKRRILEGDQMHAEDFRQLALSFDGAEEGSHMGAADFRVGGHIFATLAMEHLGFGNLMLSPELQRALIAEAPEVFLPIHGGWGKKGCTHIRLADATPEQLLKGLHAAWNLRVEKNASSRSSRSKRRRGTP
jgi:hypothetical protein